MTQAVLFTAIFVVGVMICLSVGPRQRVTLCCALAFPIGLVFVVLAWLLLAALHIPLSPTVLGSAVLASACLLALLTLRRHIWTRRTVLIIAVWSVAFAAVCHLLTQVNVSIMTSDSHHFVKMGQVIADNHGFVPGAVRRLAGYGIFQVACQALVTFVPIDYLYGLQPALGLSFAAAFVAVLWHALDACSAAHRWRLPLLIAISAVLFSINMFAFHVAYIHSNLGSAVYLFLFISLFWLAEVTGDNSIVPVAFLALAAFILHRVEAPVFAVLFLAISLPGSRLSRRTLLLSLGAFTLVTVLWLEYLAHFVPVGGRFLTPLRCRLMWAAVLGFYGYWLLSSRSPLDRLTSMLPQLTAAAIFILLLAAFALKGEHMIDSTSGLVTNLFRLPHWGLTWYAIAIASIAGLFVARPPFSRPFALGIPVFLGVVLLLSVKRLPYHFYEGDSGNRMVVHVTPLVVFYLGLKLAATLSEDPLERSLSSADELATAAQED